MTNRINIAFKEIKNSRETCLSFSNIVLTSPKAVSGIQEHPTSADKTLSPNVHVLQQQQQQTNNNPDPSSPVELLLVRTIRKKTLEKIVKSVRHESANQERQRPNNWPNSHETSWP